MATSELVDQLHALGVATGDVLMIHASLRRIGARAEVVIAALEDAVGAQGTLLMVLGAKDDHAWVNERPVQQRAELLRDAEPFDALRSPALPEVGMLAEALRTLPGTVVNDHPEGRFAARGRLARELLDDGPWNDYYGPGSPLERFVAAGGRVLRLGANDDTVTVLHYAEYLAEVPDKLRVLRHRRVLSEHGVRIVQVESLDDEDGIVPVSEQPAEDYFALILRAYRDTGRVRSGPVGSATAELIEAGDLVAFGATWMTEAFGRR